MESLEGQERSSVGGGGGGGGGGYRREKRKRGKKGYADRKKKDMQIGKKGRELVRKKRRGKKRRE